MGDGEWRLALRTAELRAFEGKQPAGVQGGWL